MGWGDCRCGDFVKEDAGEREEGEHEGGLVEGGLANGEEGLGAGFEGFARGEGFTRGEGEELEVAGFDNGSCFREVGSGGAGILLEVWALGIIFRDWAGDTFFCWVL